jgi:hypothetical protein
MSFSSLKALSMSVEVSAGEAGALSSPIVCADGILLLLKASLDEDRIFYSRWASVQVSADVELSSAPNLLIGRHCYTALGGASDGGMVVSFEWFLLLRLDLCFGMRLDGTNPPDLLLLRTGWLNRKYGFLSPISYKSGDYFPPSLFPWLKQNIYKQQFL